MATKRYKRGRTRARTHKRRKSGKKWVSAVAAADTTLKKTGSYEQAKEALRLQALRNARRLFGSVGEML